MADSPKSETPPIIVNQGEEFEFSDLDQNDLSTINGKLMTPADEDSEDEVETLGNKTTISDFFFGAGSTIVWTVLVASLLGIAGGIGYACKLKTPIILDTINLWILLLVSATFIGSFGVLRLVFNLLFRLLSIIAQWNWLHYAKELEGHITGLAWLFGWLLASSHIDQILLDSTITDDAKLATAKLLIAAIVMVLALTVKAHKLRSLAMSFNYENYRDRIEAALETDRILSYLWKARHSYKFRKRLRRTEPKSVAHFWKTSRIGELNRRGSMQPEESRYAQTLPVGRKVTEQELRQHTKFSSSDSGCQSVSVQSSPTLMKGNTSGTNHQHKASAKSLTEAQRKENFAKFSRLAAKTMSMISGSSDFRLENLREARKQAAKLFKYMKQEDRGYLVPQDLPCFIEDEHDYQFMLSLLKRQVRWQNVSTETDDFVFGEKAIRRVIHASLNELVMIVKSMQSIETALNKVDWIFTVVIGILIGFGVSIMFGSAIQLLLTATTFLSGAAFIFSTTARNAFESLIFLLFLHPFDVGDRVFVNINTFSIPTASTIPNTMSGSDSLDNLLVVEMHLLSTVFERWDGVKLYVPNYVLAMKPVFNIRRSGPLLELQRIQISFDTPISRINDLRDRLDKFVRADKTDFTDLSRVNFDTVESCNRLHLNLIVQHTSNWQDIDKQLAFRTRFLTFVKQTLEELEIGYLPPVQRIAFVDKSGTQIENFPQANLISQ